MIELSIVIPSRDRRDVLVAGLERLAGSTALGAFEVVVVDDGSRDGSADAVAAMAGALPYPLTVRREAPRGPAAARNSGVAAARAPVVLFLGDDAWSTPRLVERHVAFHRRRPAREDALLGRAIWDPSSPVTPFMRWLDEGGAQFDFALLERDEDVGGRRFYTINVSAKAELVRAAGGFDEGFPAAAAEDVELGLRLQALGMRLAYDPEALVHHHHPTSLDATLRRMGRVGTGVRRLHELRPDVELPRPPGARHRVKAGALTAAWLAGVRSERFRREVWRFLCHEAHREALHSGRGEDVPRIGRRLAALAARDPAALSPAAAPPGSAPAAARTRTAARSARRSASSR
ncbi:MAG TPA: glycosyltransferase [Solirubrobacteraceae bacterium]|nr:glycosyltransferase [Solirubrobacteraceae bacterium]